MDWLSRVLFKILILLEWTYFSVRRFFKGEEIARIVEFDAEEDPLLSFSATVLAEKIRTREITSEDVLKAYIKRINAVNPIINAVIEDRFVEATEDARNVDEFLRKNSVQEDRLKIEKPLLGVPVTIKECLAVKGLSHSGCSIVRAGTKAEDDSDVVKLLKESGAIPLLVSNTPEYCMSLESTNKIIGCTRNPYNASYVSGGSSGGEGALIGAGASVIGIGSDVLGSIRIPCAFNGIFGLKPTPGVVSLNGHFPMSSDKKFSDALAIGPLARYAEDLGLVLKILAGENASKLNLDKEVDLKQMRICFMEEAGSNFGLLSVDKDVKIAIKEAVMYLSRHSHCTVTDRKFPEMGTSMEMCSATVMTMSDPPSPLRDSKAEHGVCVELLKSVFGKSIFTVQVLVFELLSTIMQRASVISTRYAEEAERLKIILRDELQDNGVLIYPSFPTQALRPGVLFEPLGGVAYVGIFNALGFPSACVPVGFNENGMPIGIQVVAAPHQDRLCLAIAKELEKCFLGWQAPVSKKF